MTWRLRKQIIYVSIIGLLFLFIIFLIYFQSRLQALPSCFDGKKNQNEEGIDCGGPCPPCELKSAQPLKIYPTQFLTYEKTIDFIGLIENPNPNLALKKLKYYFEIYDLDNILKATTSIKETTLESETKKYLLEINYHKPDFLIGKVKLKILEPKAEDWVKKEKEKLPITFYNEKLVKENNKWKIQLTLFNQSYQRQNIEVMGLVYNQNNNLIGAGITKVSLLPQETKDAYIFVSDFLVPPTGFEIYLQK
jgi:hypothetical protein